MSGKLVTKGSIEDDNTFRFTIPGGLGHVSLEELEATLRIARLVVADVELELSRRRHIPAAPEPAQDTIGIKEWCERRSYTYSYAVRHWKRLGGWKDIDGRIKFPASAAQGRA